MRLLVAAILAIHVAAWVVLLRRRARSPQPEPKPERVLHPDTPMTRAAVHEAGHAVVAWFCTAVREVREVTISGIDPLCWTRERADDDPAAIWCRLVIALAGVAAEGLVYGRWRSAGARGDLCEARRHAAKLSGSVCPWSAPPTKIAFEGAFSERLPVEELAALQAGYGLARALLLERREMHGRLVGVLLHQERLSQAQLAEVLGQRALIRLVGIWGRCDFARPRAAR